MEGADTHQLEGIAHLLSQDYGLSAILFIVLGFVCRLWMKEMRDRIELSEKRAAIIEQNNKLIEELRDSTRDLNTSVTQLIMSLSSTTPRKRTGQ
jgi:hypothetical protein